MNKEKTFTLRLPVETYDELTKIAEKRRESIAEVIRTSIRLGLLVESEPGKWFLKEEGQEPKVIIFP